MMTKNPLRLVLLLAASLPLWSCAGLGGGLPKSPPPLADMEEPVDRLDEPDDEAERLRLDPGCFSGIHTREAAESLDALSGGGSEGLLVDRVIENSPAEAAGIEVGDLLLEVSPAGGEPVVLRRPSEWRAIELESAPGTRLTLRYDRAESERECELVLVARMRSAERDEGERFREEERVGVVIRTATEVEARRAGLAPGGGAVIVGLSKHSPWRGCGLTFGDLVVQVDDRKVSHPQVLLEAISAAAADEKLALELRRGDEPITVSAPLTWRQEEVSDVSVVPLFSHESKPGFSKTKILYGLFGYEETPAAWSFQFLWLINFGGGESDHLVEVRP